MLLSLSIYLTKDGNIKIFFRSWIAGRESRYVLRDFDRYELIQSFLEPVLTGVTIHLMGWAGSRLLLLRLVPLRIRRVAKTTTHTIKAAAPKPAIRTP